VRSGAKRIVLGGAAFAAVTLLAFPAAANAAAPNDVPGTASLTAGSLSLVTPLALSFTGTLNGTNQVLAAPQALDVLDNTGSGAGWNITLTSTTFTNSVAVPARTLPLTSASDSVTPTGACDTVAPVVGPPAVAGYTLACTLGDNSSTAYPVVVPAAATAPTAVKIQTAAVDTGLAGQTWTHTMNLAVPANTKSGTYTSTWTYSLTSAP
jgi:hypothetical protein